MLQGNDPTPSEEDKVEAPQVEDKPTEETAPEKEESEVQEPAEPNWEEKREEFRRNLSASKEEALRLKAENEKLLKQLQAQAQVYQGGGLKLTPQEQQAFQVLLQQYGVVTKEQLQEQQKEVYVATQKEELNRFLEKHPEYGKEGDPKSDAMWAQLHQELETYRVPKNPKEWGKLLNKAHRAVQGSKATEVAKEKGKALAQAEAAQAEQARQPKSGGSSPSKSSKKSPAKQEVSQGFAALRPQYYKED